MLARSSIGVPIRKLELLIFLSGNLDVVDGKGLVRAREAWVGCMIFRSCPCDAFALFKIRLSSRGRCFNLLLEFLLREAPHACCGQRNLGMCTR